MGKMTVAEAASHFKISKEAIHNRIRRGTLDCVIEHGVKYVLLEEVHTPASAQTDNRYYDYIEKENERLKEQVTALEAETRQMRTQREEMLIAERDKIEQIYKERDDQLRSVLQVVASKFLTQATMDSVIEDAVNAEVIEDEGKVIADDEDDEEEAEVEVLDPETVRRNSELVALKDFLKVKEYKKKKREKIKARFTKRAYEDSRIIIKDENIYLSPNRFDYSDLLG